MEEGGEGKVERSTVYGGFVGNTVKSVLCRMSISLHLLFRRLLTHHSVELCAPSFFLLGVIRVCECDAWVSLTPRMKATTSESLISTSCSRREGILLMSCETIHVERTV